MSFKVGVNKMISVPTNKHTYVFIHTHTHTFKYSDALTIRSLHVWCGCQLNSMDKDVLS